MHFKVGLIHFDRRSFSFGAIASFIFWSVKKLHFWLRLLKRGRCYFRHISMKTESPIKLWGSKLLFSDRLSRWTRKKYAEDQSFWLNFAVQNLPFLAIFGRFSHILDIFGPFLGHTMYVEWTSGCNQLWGSNCSIS